MYTNPGLHANTGLQRASVSGRVSADPGLSVLCYSVLLLLLLRTIHAAPVLRCL